MTTKDDKPLVACVGLTILDVLGRPVEKIPDGGDIGFIDEIRLTVAGTAAGTVIDMAKLGLNATLLGAVGQDEKGQFVRDTLDRFGVAHDGLQAIADIPTSATILNIRPNGERPGLHVRGASDHFTITDKIMAIAKSCAVVHFGGSGLLAAIDGEPTRAFLAALHQAGVTVTFDLLGVSPTVRPQVVSYLPYIDYFMPSMEEACALTDGLTDPDQVIDRLFDMGAKVCIIKNGAQGSIYATRTARFRTPAFKVAVQDTTGCGDAFCAGFVSGLLDKLSPQAACLRATAASALVATGLGSDAGIVDLAQTTNFMETAEVIG